MLAINNNRRINAWAPHDRSNNDHHLIVTLVIGTISYGFIDRTTGSMRNSMVFMAIFFIGGFIILQRAQLKKHPG